MTKKPEIVKVNETQYKCSCGEWKWELNTAKMPQPAAAQMQRLMEQRFAEHVRQSHSREDVNQAAARVVREATEKI